MKIYSNYIAICCVVALSGCATTPVNTNVQRPNTEAHQGLAIRYIIADSCFNQGFIDSDTAAKGLYLNDLQLQRENFDKNLIDTARNQAMQENFKVPKEVCNQAILGIKKASMQYDNQVAQDRENQRNAALIYSNQQQNTGYTPQKTTYCNNIAGTVICNSF